MDYYKLFYELLEQKFLEKWTLIATIFNTVFTSVYVIFTIKTFKQIKKQTDIQYRALLLVMPSLCEKKVEGWLFNSKAEDLNKKWQDIITNNLPIASTKETYLSLKLNNRGKSDVIKWKINMIVKIESGSHLNTKYSITSDSCTFSISSNDSQYIQPDSDIEIPILLSGAFPKAEILWEIKYDDLRDESYVTNNFNNPYIVFNKIAYEHK